MRLRIAAVLLTCLVSVTTSFAAEAEAPIVPKEKVELFNGKNLDGWTSHLKDKTDPATVWGVKDGLMTCLGKPNGYLHTDKSYADYKVTVEWRFAKAGNTGVLVHINGADKVWPLCVECQGMHAQQGDMYYWSGAKCKELTKGPKVPRKAPDAEKAVGEWNTFTVICDKDTITVLVNDKEMNKTTGGSLNSGQIAMQCEGAQLEIRKVTLEPLTP